MKPQKFAPILFVVFLFLISLSSPHQGAGPHQESPSNIQKVADYNTSQANYYFQKLSILVAFLVGIIGILSPCSLAILPTFFAYTFEEKRNLAKMTLIFFLGFAPVFIGLGMLAAFLGKTIAGFQSSNGLLVSVSGIFIIVLGVMTLFGKGFSGLKINKKIKGSVLGIFLFGVFFAVGFTACVGPALFGILLIAGTLQSYAYASVLMLSYSLGLFSTLFLVSFFFDKFNFAGYLSKLNKKIGFSLTNVIAGLLLILIGGIFLIYNGTSIVTGNLGLGEFTVKIYSIMESVIEWKYSNLLGAVLLFAFLFFIWKKILGGKNE